VCAGDRPAGLDRVAGGLRGASARGSGRLRAGACDAPRPRSSTRARPRPTAATASCSPTPRAPTRAGRTGSRPPTRRSSGCGYWAARTTTSPTTSTAPPTGSWTCCSPSARRWSGCSPPARPSRRPGAARPLPDADCAARRDDAGLGRSRSATRRGWAPGSSTRSRPLDAQTVTVPAETAGWVIRELAEELDRLAARRDQLAQEIERTFTRHPRAPVLMSIPGIGAQGPAHGSSPRSVTSTDSPPQATSPPTPTSPPSPANPAARSTARLAAAVTVAIVRFALRSPPRPPIRLSGRSQWPGRAPARRGC
jgi:hypothetical protein